MYEGIDPRQYGIEVGTEDECELKPDTSDDMNFYGKLLKFTEVEVESMDEGDTETTGACMRCKSAGVCNNIRGLRQEVEREMIPPYVEQFETSVQDDTILVGSLSLEQARDQRRRFCETHMNCWSQEEHLVQQQKLSVKTQEEDTKQPVIAFSREKTKDVKLQEINSEQLEFLQASLRSAFQKAESQLLKALESRRGEVVTLYGDLTEVKQQYNGVQGCGWKVEWSGTPQPTQIHLKCLRGVKDKLPKGWYSLRVCLHSQLGGSPLHWSNLKDQHWAQATLPVHHDGNFYDIELSFNQSIAMIIKLPRSLLGQEQCAVELQIPPQLLASHECSNSTKRLRTSQNTVHPTHELKVDWTQQTELRDLHLLPQCSWPSGRPQDHNTYGSSSKCAKKFDELIGISGESGVFPKGSHHNLAEFSGKDKCQSPVDQNRFSAESPCLEDLDQYHFSVVSDSCPDKTTETLAWHAQFMSQIFLDQLRALRWCSSETVLLLLLVALVWFVRLYLHYCSQWIYLQAIGVTVNKFHFYPHTVELSYQSSLLKTCAELTTVALGPLSLNAVLLIMAIIRWICHRQFGSFPSCLSRFITAMGFWTVLDPLATFIVDGVLGRLTYSTTRPIGDAAKLYWLFYRTQHSGIPGILITVILYLLIFLCSLTILYLHLLSLQTSGQLVDSFYRLHSTEERFFVPLDLELSNQELSLIVKRAEQWRGIDGERRKMQKTESRYHQAQGQLLPSC